MDTFVLGFRFRVYGPCWPSDPAMWGQKIIINAIACGRGAHNYLTQCPGSRGYWRHQTCLLLGEGGGEGGERGRGGGKGGGGGRGGEAGVFGMRGGVAV